MIHPKALTVALAAICFAEVVTGQREQRWYLDAREAHVLDRLLSPDAKTEPFMDRLTLRFGDTCTQLVISTAQDWRTYSRSAELVRSSPVGGCEGLSKQVQQMFAQNPKLTDEELASNVQMEVMRAALDPKGYDRVLDRLKAVRVSPYLHSRITCDGPSATYGYLYETPEESVHYVLNPPFGKTPEDNLARWMDEFRTNIPKLRAAPAVP